MGFRTTLKRWFKPAQATTEKTVSRAAAESFKQERLARIGPFLICPNCRGELNKSRATCNECGRVYLHTPDAYNFLTPEHKEQFQIVATDNVAANEYDHIATEIIERHANGLILDCGAGRHRREYPHVIFYEIVQYPSTDVMGVAERLPFRDETFAAVFSLNVLEHVADPFSSAAEITRVLKPGGTLYCVVPFLQPVHGYPNHFYNMSAQGLRNLFEKQMEILKQEVPISGLPIWTLSWILKSWADGLQGETREKFLDLRVRDLTAREPLDYVELAMVKGLSSEKNMELASTTMIIATKK